MVRNIPDSIHATFCTPAGFVAPLCWLLHRYSRISMVAATTERDLVGVILVRCFALLS